MADKVVLEAEVKSNIGEVSKDAEELTGELKIMGISLNDVKQGFNSMAGVAKASFRTIKAGLISTGLGAFLVLLGSVVTFFTKTKRGAEQLETAFAGIGAAVNVIVERIAKFGGGIVKLLTGQVREGLSDISKTFSNIGKEILTDTLNAAALNKMFQQLRDSERALNVETAQRRAEIEALKLIAEDVSKTEKERLDAAKAAFKIENDLLQDRIANAEKAVEIQRKQNELKGEEAILDEDLDALAEKETNLANIKAESTTKQIELNNKINAIEAEVAAKRAERNQARLDEIAAEKKASDDLYDAQIAQANAFEARVQVQADREKAIAKDLENFKKTTISAGFGAAAAMAGENVALSKGVAAAQTIYNTQQGITAALAATSIDEKLMPFPLRLANAISVGVMGAAALKNIMSTNPTGAGVSGGGASVASSGSPAPQMMSGAFDLSGGLAPEPVQAFVLTDDMTNSQNQLANIRRRATI